ncbi:MAG: C1 family peptidase [Chloroflexi bacterium]|nr:C1 family peptidase [Chloroflexota bacterium]
MPDAGPSQSINAAQLAAFRQSFQADPKNRLAMNAIIKNPVQSVALNHDVVTATDHTFSHQLKSNEATSQASSGRCWLFAGLNLFRVEVMKNCNLEKFELSQNYMMFWDKLEKANYFLESILKTLDETVDSRLIMFLMQNPIQDGGQWDMFVNLVKKYGVAPKTVMPETESSSNTRWMTAMITARLREDAAELRRMHAAGRAEADLRSRKDAMLSDIYRMLVIHLGEPPADFNWQWRDKDNAFHRDGTITPQEFFARYVKVDLDSMVCLINCPTADKPYNKLYTVQYLGNVVEGYIVRYINVDIATFKKATVDMLVAETPVWFGCDVGKGLERDLGILSTDLYDYTLAYNTAFQSDKAERVDYGQSQMTHAMVFTGVDIDTNGKPTKWRVENSWGDKVGDKGFLVMTDGWFDEYMYEVVVSRRFVAPELLALLDTEPVRLAPWDPMGSLAAAE